MNRAFRFALVMGVGFALTASLLRATEEQEETLGDKLKKLFVRPTPTPTPKKKKTARPSAAKSPTVSPTETPAPSGSPGEAGGTSPPGNEAAAASASAGQTATPSGRTGTQYFEAVRPISPPPHHYPGTPRRAAPVTQPTAFPTMTVFPEVPNETPVTRPIPNLPPLDTNSEAQATPEQSETPPAAPSVPLPKTAAPRGAIGLEQISEAATYSAEIKKIIDFAIDLTGRNLGYKYVSADPKNGGMDSSGFIYYVLTESGVKNVPRDAREQYVWTRKAGTFQAVLAQRDDTFELDGLKPGDLLFWASNYGTSRDPDITQTMIYLGRENGTNQRLMVGASETLSSKGQKKPGVGVFEFKVSASKPKDENGPIFVGYGAIPGVTAK